jgi:hypothetical protein
VACSTPSPYTAQADAPEMSFLQMEEAQEMEKSLQKARAVVTTVSKQVTGVHPSKNPLCSSLPDVHLMRCSCPPQIGDSEEAADACARASQDEQDIITEEIKTEDEILEDILTTKECDNLGVNEVNQAKKLQIGWKSKLEKSKKCKAKADTTPVPFCKVQT